MKRESKLKAEVEERNHPVFCLLSFVLASFVLLGCSRTPVERVEWPTMGSVAAVQFRGGPVDETVRGQVRRAFDETVAEFNAFDAQSAINRQGQCTDFGQPCWDFAFKLKEETQGAFDPYWKKNGKLDFGAVAKGFAVDVAAERIKPTVDTLIDLGGNLKAVKGDWTVGVKGGGSFVLREGEACATSARYYRGDHIKDARSGAAVTNAAYSVTVIHPSSAMVADGLSTVMFILGRAKGETFVKAHYPSARVLWLPFARP